MHWMAGGLLTAISVGFVGLAFSVPWAARQSYQDYDEVEACLTHHQFKVEDGWQHRDTFLEDFGWFFRLPSGQPLGIDIYDHNSARDCDDRADGVQLIFGNSFGDGLYLAFDHPALVDALQGERIRTMDEMFDQLEWLVTWAEDHPETLVSQAPVKRERYLNLLLLPEGP
ncbi:MAG: hypothetical protein AAFV72_02160 [Cyanobacteria bacterium J06635_1]